LLYLNLLTDKTKMGDVDRIGRINEKINLINSMIADINSEKYSLQREMNETNAQGEDFFDYIQEIGELDQQIWDLKTEKQRLLDLI
jgi:methyl-accepting chemotaxis protein